MLKASRRDREASEKRNLLRALIDGEGDKCTNAIIFCNRKVDVDIVAKSLTKYGYDAAPIHGDLDQSQRTRTLDGFRAGDLRFLIASDVAARGLDVPAVSHVFNFDVPSHAEDYVHRIGRTGRAGRDGKALMICIPRDEKNLAAIENLLQNQIPRVDNPLQSGTAPEAEAEAAPAPEKKVAKPRVSRRSKKSEEQKADAPAAKVEETPKPQEAPVAAKEAPVAAKEATPEPQQTAPKPERKERSSRRGGGGGSDRGRQDQGGGRVKGMGDHLPGFIALSFDERRTR
jgi:superfamily II DNA/RNA helicase